MRNKSVRCAIYTRKSSEEGLEQSFNSLEAQREACEAFILSQKHEGWAVIENQYDDGGFSGGSMERPALTQLMDDIRAGKVDNVIVYKVDRLTRSLTDFSKIIEVFDSRGVSFVSVTQQFNTTTSMGRLTLNVLLSFAQFEREVTGERIRDKIAASKKKGMWMGGVVPLGYDCLNHQLLVNRPEAERVRTIFRHYLRLGCVSKLKTYLDRKEVYSKTRVSLRGRSSGGGTYSRGALYHLLRNPAYVGEIRHRGQCYQGRHEAIVPRELWDQVAQKLSANNQAHRTGSPRSMPSLLTGIVFDTQAVPFTPTHAAKKGRRYRYYTSQAVIRKAGAVPSVARYSAGDLEELVSRQFREFLAFPRRYDPNFDLAAIDLAQDLATRWPKLEFSKRHDFLKAVLKRVTVGRSHTSIQVDRAKLLQQLLGHPPENPLATQGSAADFVITSAFQPLQKSNASRLAVSNRAKIGSPPAPSLVKAIAKARDWYQRIVSGELSTMAEIARTENVTQTYVKRILACASLSPQVTEAILSGKHQFAPTLHQLLNTVSLDWRKQQVPPPR